MSRLRASLATIAFVALFAVVAGLAPSALGESPAEVQAAYDRDKARLDERQGQLVQRLKAVINTQNYELDAAREELRAVTAQLVKNRVAMERLEQHYKSALAKAQAALEEEKRRAHEEARKVVRTTEVGGANGGDHRFESAVAPVRVFAVMWGRRVNGISLNDAPWNEKVTGGRKPSDKVTRVVLNPGETIVSVRIKYGRTIDSLLFKSNHGRTWQFGGGGGGPEVTLSIPEGDEWRGIIGMAGEVLDSFALLSGLKD